MITVVLVEDHSLVREGIHALLRKEDDIKVVGEAQDGRQAVQLVKSLLPEVVVMDIGMPSLNGAEAARQILAAVPQCRILFLSAHADEAKIEQAMKAGAYGYLIKDESCDLLAKGIRALGRGKTFFSPCISEHMNQVMARMTDASLIPISEPALSSRAVETLQLVAEGKANKQIAVELGISIKTVEKHRHQLMEKLNIHDTAGLTRYAIASGIIEGNPQIT